MSNASEELIAEGRAEGEKKNLLENIRTLMNALKLSSKEVMDLLKVPSEKQKELAPLI